MSIKKILFSHYISVFTQHKNWIFPLNSVNVIKFAENCGFSKWEHSMHSFLLVNINHCVKSVRTRRFSGPYFPAFGLNTERYGAYLCIQSKCEKIWTRETPNTDTFHAMNNSVVLADLFIFAKEAFNKKYVFL